MRLQSSRKVIVTGLTRMICENCGSEDVLADAWAVWSAAEQRWEIGEVFDYGHCNRCNGEARIVRRGGASSDALPPTAKLYLVPRVTSPRGSATTPPTRPP